MAPVADLDLLRVAEGRHGNVVVRGESHEGEVLPDILADELAVVFAAVLELDLDFRGVAGHMVVRENVDLLAVLAHDHAGAEAGPLEFPLVRFLVFVVGPRISEEKLEGRTEVEGRNLLFYDFGHVDLDDHRDDPLGDLAETVLISFQGVDFISAEAEVLGREELGRTQGQADRKKDRK